MNTIKGFLRHLAKNKLYTAVTVLGFAISLTFVILLSVYVSNEVTVDDFHRNKELIYRLENETVDFSPPIATDLKESYPEIESFTRMLEGDGRIMGHEAKNLKIDYLGVDKDFFDIFSYPLLKGNPKKVLQSIDDIVLSKSMALKLFETVDVVGQTVYVNTDYKFFVSGVMEDFPKNTHLIYQDALVNIAAFKNLWGFETILKEYGFASVSIYFLARENSDLPSKAPQILEKFKKDYWLYQEGWANKVEFTPLKDLYFSSKVGNGSKNNSKILIAVLSIIVFLILILAVGNYINLTIAQATFRGKEVAIKKLLGGSKKQLVLQFIKESVSLTLAAVLLALVFAKLVEPIFDSLLETRLNLNDKMHWVNVCVLIGTMVLVGIISGILPAINITAFKPIEVVKGTFRTRSKSIYGKIFTTFQYTVTIALLASSWIILKQTHFLRSKDLGFQKNNIVHLEYLAGLNQKKVIKNALLEIPGVQDVSITWQSQLSGGSNQTFDYNGRSLSFQEFAVDSSFFSVFDIKVIPTKAAYTKDGVYLNETAFKELELDKKAVTFDMGGDKKPILGIVNNFNFKGLRDRIGPLMLRQQHENFIADNIFLRINGKNTKEITNKIKSTYSNLIGDVEFEITFVDETISQWYERDERTGKIMGSFTLLSLIISVMGVLAMSTFYMQQRKKEIGIRKVNGATISQILKMLNQDLVKWIGLAFTIAVPIVWYAMNRWLENFAYKTTMDWWIFILAGLTTLLIAFITVSWQSFRAATINPVEVLKNE